MQAFPEPSAGAPEVANTDGGAEQAILIFSGRSNWRVSAAAALEQLATDLLPEVQALTRLNAVEICRRQANELHPLPVVEPVSFLLNYTYGRELVRRGVNVVATAGYSLGEYAALVLAESLDFETALRLVRARAEAIERAMAEQPLRMVRVEGVETETIVELCSEQGDVWPATFDSPTQVVVGGEPGALDRVAPKFREAGASRIVLVLSNGGLHTHSMERAGATMKELLADVRIEKPKVPVASSVSARMETDPERWRELLADQVHSPSRWYDTVRTLPSSAVLVECGGERLIQLVDQFEPERRTLIVNSMTDLDEALRELTGTTTAG